MIDERRNPLPEPMLAAIFDIIVEECGCDPSHRDDLVRYVQEYRQGEYRFQGDLGFGGKLYWTTGVHMNHFRVNAYQEDITPERRAMIERANNRLQTPKEGS